MEESKGKGPLQDNATNKLNDSDCCEQGRMYKTETSHTKAYLTLNSFEKNGDGGGPSDCKNQYHSGNMPVVALSTGWFNHKSRCHKKITMVVDQCDSTKGCDADQDYQPPCANNIVDASNAVWEALVYA